jgi:hypothetical protein
MQTAAVVGVVVNLQMVTTVVISTTQSISAGPVRPWSQQRTPSLSYQRQPMMCPYSKRLVSQSWNTLNGISQRY